jgi:uncharacterized membrane protein (Fun14 family)
MSNNLSIENLVFLTCGGFLSGAVVGYAIKKVMKVAAVVIRLFVVGISYLSYKGWIDVKWLEMEDATKTTLTSVAGQAIHASSFRYSKSITQQISTNFRIPI